MYVAPERGGGNVFFFGGEVFGIFLEVFNIVKGLSEWLVSLVITHEGDLYPWLWRVRTGLSSHLPTTRSPLQVVGPGWVRWSRRWVRFL